jgi:hypothetical protein
MSRYLMADHIYQIIGEASATTHDGSLYINKDYPIGTIICQGRDGEWYRLTNDQHLPPRNADVEELKELFPRRSAINGIELFRDYWRIIDNSFSPYTRAIMNAAKQLIV